MKKELEILQELEEQKISIQNQLDCGIINYNDASSEFDMIRSKEYKLKEKMVKEVHKTRSGKERTISYIQSMNLYTTKMPDSSQIRAKDMLTLFDKILNYYNIVATLTVSGIFHVALSEQSYIKNLDEKSILRYKDSYKRFIDNAFAEKDITTLDTDYLQFYTKSLIDNGIIKDRKVFYAYKGILNLIFTYALRKNIISVNPLATFDNSIYKKSCPFKRKQAENAIFSEEEIKLIQNEIRERFSHPRYHGYFVNGYAILLSIETGMRIGELCALKWSDIHEEFIHIHSMQVFQIRQGYKEYSIVDYTKNEKGVSQDGRYFPKTAQISKILNELKELQKEKNISSEFVFCKADGSFTRTEGLDHCLRAMCEKLGLSIKHNHAFRMSLNSNVFIPLGIPETDRAKLLGHSVQTNLMCYSFERKDYVSRLKNILDTQAI